jgi:hypothetical protein
MTAAEIAQVEELAESYRARLHDLSWLMRTSNEHVARLANAENGVKGRFWEGRFKSQALLDEKALLAAMAHVDLNPVRARLAETPEGSDYTSIQERLGYLPASAALESEPESAAAEARVDIEASATTLEADVLQPESEVHTVPQAALMPFDGTARTPWAIPFAFTDYLELVDWTGRALRSDKRGHLSAHQPKILERLGIDGERFITYAARLLKEFGTSVGAPAALVDLCARRQTTYLRGMRAARRLFATPHPA